MSPAPVRIALVAPFGLRAKGTTRARSLPLGKALSRRGYAIRLFVPPYDDPPDNHPAGPQEWTEEGVRIINVRIPPKVGSAGLLQGVWHLRLGLRLYLAVRAWRPHIIHAFKPKGPSGLAATCFWVGRRNLHGPRVIVDSDDWEGPGGWNDDLRVRYSRMERRFFAWQERYGLRHADAWTVTSGCLAERAANFGADSRHVYVLPNGLSDFGRELLHAGLPAHSSSSGVNPAPAILLYTRFAGVRAAEVAAVWAEVRRALPTAVLTIAGRGVGGEERALEGLPGIRMAGWQEPAELRSLFARQTIAIVPWADTATNRARHSVKVLELMAAGLPIVASGVGELPATLDEAGVTVPPGQAPAFAEAVVALVQDPGRAARLGAAARLRVARYYNWDALAESALMAYDLLHSDPDDR